VSTEANILSALSEKNQVVSAHRVYGSKRCQQRKEYKYFRPELSRIGKTSNFKFTGYDTFFRDMHLKFHQSAKERV
jgi:hypothetical protein